MHPAADARKEVEPLPSGPPLERGEEVQPLTCGPPLELERGEEEKERGEEAKAAVASEKMEPVTSGPPLERGEEVEPVTSGPPLGRGEETNAAGKRKGGKSLLLAIFMHETGKYARYLLLAY